MPLLERIKQICLTPKTEWEVIAHEQTTIRAIVLHYVLPLAGLGALANFIGSVVVGHTLPLIGTYRVPVMTGISTSVLMFVMSVIGTFVMAFAINQLAARFGGQKDALQAFKVAAYAYTPVWVASVFLMIPMMGFLSAIAGFYGLYLLFLGLPLLMKSADNKSITYTALVVVSALVLSMLINFTLAMFSSVNMLSGPGSINIQSDSEVKFDQDSPLGKLQNFSKKMEDMNAKMEEAKSKGDPQQEMDVAMQSVGAILGGGQQVEPVGIEQLKSLLPENFAGLAQTSHSAEKNGAMGIMVSKAEARYADSAGKEINLSISDMGGVSGLLGLASWVNVQSEKEDSDGYEKNYKVDGRMLHEKASGTTAEFSVVVADRFMVSAQADGVSTAELKEAVLALPLADLEALQE